MRSGDAMRKVQPGRRDARQIVRILEEREGFLLQRYRQSDIEHSRR
jgi:hypothetical protein